jgi:hypothetical protein
MSHRLVVVLVVGGETLFLGYRSTNSMEQSPSWKADSHSASQEILPLLWKLKAHYHIPRACCLSLSWARCTHSSPIYLRYILILPSHLLGYRFCVKFVGYNHKVFLIPNVIVLAIMVHVLSLSNWKFSENVCVATMLFYSLQKCYLNKGYMFLNDLLSNLTSGPYTEWCLCWSNLLSSYVVITDWEIEKVRVASIGITFIPKYVRISELI